MALAGVFESLVSFEGCKTIHIIQQMGAWFESFVSFEGCKTIKNRTIREGAFESLVSFEGCKTQICFRKSDQNTFDIRAVEC